MIKIVPTLTPFCPLSIHILLLLLYHRHYPLVLILGGKSKKPLYKRLEEMKHQRDLEEERQRQEEYAKYRIDRARAQPTREEIEQHMRDHEVYVPILCCCCC
jgi:hypothetical protein